MEQREFHSDPLGKFEIHEEEPVFTSGVVSRLLEIPVWILKQLDREKIISPPRKKGKARLYSQKDIKQLRRIWYYMNVRNVNIHGVRVILEMEEKFFPLEEELE